MGRWLRALALLLALVVVAALAVGSRGTNDRYRTWQTGPRPAWADVCAHQHIIRWSECERVKGRVAWIDRHDSDGDGDVHLAVVARLGVHVVKLQRWRHLDVPSLGQTVAATGPMFNGASGHPELAAVTLR